MECAEALMPATGTKCFIACFATECFRIFGTSLVEPKQLTMDHLKNFAGEGNKDHEQTFALRGGTGIATLPSEIHQTPKPARIRKRVSTVSTAASKTKVRMQPVPATPTRNAGEDDSEDDLTEVLVTPTKATGNLKKPEIDGESDEEDPNNADARLELKDNAGVLTPVGKGRTAEAEANAERRKTKGRQAASHQGWNSSEVSTLAHLSFIAG